MISSDLLTVPELSYMLVGEKITNDSLLYSEIWDDIAPLSAFVYGIIDFLFGRSQLAFQILAYILACYHVYIFNKIMLVSRAFAENTYIPGYIYAILTSISYDMVTLSPFLIGLTFILMALGNIFSHIEVRAKRDEDILNIGIYIGLATICYLPFSIYAICTLVIFILFTGTVGRRYALMTFGFFLPIILTAGYFYLTNRISDFVYCFLAPFTIVNKVWFISMKHTLILFTVPIAFFILAFLRVARGTRLTNYQARLTQGMFVWFVFSGLFIILSDVNSPSVYIALGAAISFYLTHYYIVKKRGFFTEMSFLLFVALVVTTAIFTTFKSPLKDYFDDSDYLVTTKNAKKEKVKRILILDDDIKPYINSKSATPFINWQLSRRIFENLDYYDNLTLIHNGFKSELPDEIIDPNHVMESVFDRIPSLSIEYRKTREGNYIRRI